MSQPALTIDLEGAENKWTLSGDKICADCERNFNTEELEDQADPIPLLLFKEVDGKVFLLCFCWNCARLRMQNKRGN